MTYDLTVCIWIIDIIVVSFTIRINRKNIFSEAVRFFNIKAASNEEFKNLRRELKVIVRTKIRRNERKYQPWSKKKKIKRS